LSTDHGMTSRPRGGAGLPLILLATAASALAVFAARTVRAADVDPALELATAAPAANPATALRGLQRLATVPDAAPALAQAIPPQGAASGSVGLAAIQSGLPWRSGASCAEGDFERWRGRRLDANTMYLGHASWNAMVDRLRGGYFKGVAHRSPQPSISVAMFPDNLRHQHAACARGQFDSYFRQFGQLMAQAGAGHAVVRIGWEANTVDNHAWSIASTGDIPAYVSCFRRLATALKQASPNLKIEWSNAKKGKLKVNVLNTYPGDAYADLWGVHYYDSGADLGSPKGWAAFYDSTNDGGPQGIGQWLKQARAHGKKLAVPEWGVWDQGGGAKGADDPGYIQNMFQFFKANAGDIAYENYYNCPARHRIFPGSPYPKASAAYRQLWSAGR
jgi:hypothetical protein